VKSINVDGLPKPIARALVLLVEALRGELRSEPQRRPRVKLPVHEGTILTPLSRRDLYERTG
jgi:hypothetical protein